MDVAPPGSPQMKPKLEASLTAWQNDCRSAYASSVVASTAPSSSETRAREPPRATTAVVGESGQPSSTAARSGLLPKGPAGLLGGSRLSSPYADEGASLRKVTPPRASIRYWPLATRRVGSPRMIGMAETRSRTPTGLHV